MTLEQQFSVVRNVFYGIINTLFGIIARILGYPGNPGMPSIPSNPKWRGRFYSTLERREFDATFQDPQSVIEVLLGEPKQLNPIIRHTYANDQEGYYNFYIKNYENIFFLPDRVSTFIQIKLHICVDITVLEALQEALFILMIVYSQVLTLRIVLHWFININPYTYPWYYIVGLVDWMDEAFQGIIPTITGINLSTVVCLTIFGRIADSLNNMVFTMPFLPSEGEKAKLLMDGKMTDILLFHYFPNLWYRYPIPNQLRLYWYKERPEILEYLEKNYSQLNIRLLPDHIAGFRAWQERNALTELLLNNIDYSRSTDILPIDNLILFLKDLSNI